MVGRDTPEPNARGDCTDLAAVAGSGQRSENPPALAVESVKKDGSYQNIFLYYHVL